MWNSQMLPLTKLLAPVLVAALAVATGASVSDATTEASKRVKCKRGYVVVKINKKATCRRTRSVFPKPRTGNRTLIGLKAALNVARSDLRTKRGKRARALPRRVAVAQKKGRKAMLRALPKLGAMLRGLEQRLGTTGGRRARAMAARRPCGGPGSTQPVSDTGRSGELGIQATMGPNGEEGGVMTFTFNGITQQTTFTKCGSKFYYVSGCPKSNGDAATAGSGRFTVTTRTMQGGRLLNSQSTDWTYEDKLLGKVMDDAKLRYFDFTRKEHKLTVASGGVVQAGDATRTIRVNMPSGSYDRPHSSARITGDPEVFKEDDLAASIDMAITEYKEAENGGSFLHTDGWATFDRQRDPYCAKAQFSPATETIRVKKSQQYQLSFHAKGQDGGTATGARWTLLDPTNAVFNPNPPTGASPTISYTVSSSPAGDRVRVTLKFTSTAGVGKDSWSEPLDDIPTINHITGTFSGTYKIHSDSVNQDSIVTWTGNARFDRVSPAIFGGAFGSYSAASGGYDLHASGLDGSGVTACQQSGTKHLNLGEPGSGSFQVNPVGFPASFDPPYTYSIQAAAVGAQVFNVTLHDCPPGAESMEGATVPIISFPAALQTGQAVLQSDDGIVYNGSTHESASGVTLDQSWEFDGTE